MISSLLGFLITIGLIGIGLFALLRGLHFVVVILYFIAVSIALGIDWLIEWFKKFTDNQIRKLLAPYQPEDPPEPPDTDYTAPSLRS